MENPNQSPVYLDYNATTPLDALVIKEISRSLTEDWPNPSSSYEFGVKSKSVVERSRCSIAQMINANPEDILFTSGGTEANNLVLLSVAAAETVCSSIDEGCRPHIICSNVEHDSVMRILEELEKKHRIDLSVVYVDCNGIVPVGDVLSLIRPSTCLVSVMHANNESGIIMPIEEIGRQLQSINDSRTGSGLKKIKLHTDAAQTIGKIAVNVEKLNVDFLTIVGHKFYGPRIGGLYVRNLLQGETSLVPVFFGGGQERGFRPGTENTPMIAGLGKAADLVCQNLDDYEATLIKLKDKLEMLLKENIPGLKMNFGEGKEYSTLPNTLSISLPEGLIASEVLKEKCKGKLFASLGAACHSSTSGVPSKILMASGVSADEALRTIRLSVGRTTREEDLYIAVKILKEACFLTESM